MTDKPVPRRVLLPLLVGVLLVPVIAWAIVAVAALLGAMGDAVGAAILNRIAWLGGAVWAVDLICLVVCQTLNSLGEPERRE